MQIDEKNVEDADALTQAAQAAAEPVEDVVESAPLRGNITDVLFPATPPQVKNARVIRRLGI